ncbi:hypothetical protein V1512DRAFT_234956 [Lipomyces arxii]|uniref:uncharacterized protein n=1 Tax=Lipomyces arxii TaxID=56418 RepID=UPI0034CFBA28
MSPITKTVRGSIALLVAAVAVTAHEHDESEIPEGEYISVEPIDSILWVHIVMMMIAFGLVFPVGMVLGMTHHRLHVPLQVTGGVLAIVAYFLGHHHKGREFSSDNIHSKFAPVLMSLMFAQIFIGGFLKLHYERGVFRVIRKVAVTVHGVAGKAMPVAAWVQMGFGGITVLGFCHESHLGQCLAHGIMGSAFIGYGCVLAIMMLVGQAWLARTGRSQEFFDSAVITAWGIVNTFTEHRWGQPWSHGDYQHTSMGIIWWCAGMLGIFLSRKNGRPVRNHVPGLVIILTGWAMSVHAQHLELSTKIHAMFGLALMSAGLARIIEVSFVLHDQHTDGEPKAWQHISPFMLVASGFLFMFANEEQLIMIAEHHIDHASYTLIIYSVAFLVYLYFLCLISLYSHFSGTSPYMKFEAVNDELSSASASYMAAPGSDTDDRQVRDAEEFELNGLMHRSV